MCLGIGICGVVGAQCLPFPLALGWEDLSLWRGSLPGFFYFCVGALFGYCYFSRWLVHSVSLSSCTGVFHFVSGPCLGIGILVGGWCIVSLFPLALGWAGLSLWQDQCLGDFPSFMCLGIGILFWDFG